MTSKIRFFIVSLLLVVLFVGLIFVFPHSVHALGFWSVVISLFFLGMFTLSRIVRVWRESRSGPLGTKFQRKVVFIVSTLVMTPSVVMALFAVIFLQSGLQVWFNKRVQVALYESQNVAEAYLSEHQKVIEHNIRDMAQVFSAIRSQLDDFDLAVFHQNPLEFFRQNNDDFVKLLTLFVKTSSLREAIIFIIKDGKQEIVAQSPLAFAIVLKSVAPKDIQKAKVNGIFLSLNEARDEVFAIVPILAPLDAYLFVSKPVDPKVLDRVARASQAVTKYKKLLTSQNNVIVAFIVVFILFTINLLLLVIWGGLVFARQFTLPIGDMIDAAELVRSGEHGVEAKECGTRIEEVRTLVRTFNTMVHETEEQRETLVGFNKCLQDRTHLIENVLSSVSSGVMSLKQDGTILLSNQQARALLRRTSALEGKLLSKVAISFCPLLEKAIAHPGVFQEDQIVLEHFGRIFRVSAIVDPGSSEAVLTFGDISELLSAQKKAAWSDVARRIAHEIKNPLTPIRLSVERLKRKYFDSVSDQDVFQKCVDTVIRQVEHIGRLISEFSTFARMPNPILVNASLKSLTQQAIFLQQQAYADIAFSYTSSQGDFDIACDPQQLEQAIANILKNAIEAIQERQKKMPKPIGEIAVALKKEREGIALSICDNGVGFPFDPLEWTEPYVTTKEGGTGLGLSIVKKIIEDHKGKLLLANRSDKHGACVTLCFSGEKV